MKIKWTPKQEESIHTTGTNLLISAAAGSGKTAVLAARCAYLVCDAPEPCDVTELLVVTFTNSAAEEMRRRIGQAIHERAATTNNPRLMRQSLLVNAAQISTIHGLGQSIIRRHYHDLGIDPGFRVLGEDETRLMRSEIVNEVLESRFGEETAVDFRKLVNRYANGQPRVIASIVLAMHARLASVIDPGDWLAERRLLMKQATTKPLHKSTIGSNVYTMFLNRLKYLITMGENLALTCSQNESLSAYAKYLKISTTDLRGMLKQAEATSHSWQTFVSCFQTFAFDRLPKAANSNAKEKMQKRIDKWKDQFRKLLDNGLFAFTSTQLQEGVGQSLWVTDQITDLVQRFEVAYTQAKRAASGLDFNDLEQLALKLLREPGSGQIMPSRIAKEYQKQFRHVMVDEFQDVNPVQDTILTLLGRTDNHFAVGDVKQSIYRFRQADPQRFIERYNRYKQDKPSSGKVIDLQQNFRSRGRLLETLNQLFKPLVTIESAEVDYDDSQKLVPGAIYSESAEQFAGSPIELHRIEKPQRLAPRDLTSTDREAVLASSRIRTLMGLDGGTRAVVTDRDGSTRPIEPRDIVILLRAVRMKAERFASILRRANIPVQADSTNGFFAATEVGDVLNVLRLLVNRRDDLSLAAYLRSALCGWEDAEDKLASIRLAYPFASNAACFHQAYALYRTQQIDPLAKLLKQAERQLDRWRALGRNKPVGEVLQAILQDTGYLSYIAGLPDGAQRVANVMQLYERARQFETFKQPTIARFLGFLETIEDENDLGMPAVAGVAQNAVRIMSIHKSKGLEFPVVIIPDLGKKHNFRDTSEKLLFEDSVGIAARMVDDQKEVHYATVATILASSEMKRKQIAEELRVLYVATTRAKEHLILIGTSDLSEETWDMDWAGYTGTIDAMFIRDGATMLDWIGPASSIANSQGQVLFDRFSYPADDINKMAEQLLHGRSTDAVPEMVAHLKPLNVEGGVPKMSKAVTQVVNRLSFQYPWQFAIDQPAVTSVTAVTKSGKTAPGGKAVSTTDIVQFMPTLDLPPSLNEVKKLSPTEIGTVTHDVLQRMDLREVCDLQSLETALSKLVERKFLRNDELPYVDRAAILWFLEHPLGRRMREAADLRRELSISYVQEVGNGELTDLQLVRGRLDAVLVEADGLTVIDYKTDRVTAETVDLRADFYRGQIDAYRQQLRELTGRAVKAAYLVFLQIRQVVEVSDAPPVPSGTTN